MTRNALILAAVGGSVLLLAGAFTFQAMGYLPCEMCWWQRYPHMAAIAIGLAALATRGPALPSLGALAALATALLGVFHAGVERHWWPGPASCTGNGVAGLGDGDLTSLSGIPHLVMCDQVAWQMWGLSMAAWNALFSFVLVALWVTAALRSRRARLTRAA